MSTDIERFTAGEVTLREFARTLRQGDFAGTLREFARTLRLEPWAAHDVLRANGVSVAQGLRAETAGDLQSVLDDIAG